MRIPSAWLIQLLSLRWPPQVAILDLGMPGITGYDLARRFRSQASLATVKLVAFSGFGQLEDRQRCEAAGFDLHLTKPVSPARLQEVLEELALDDKPAGGDRPLP